MTAKLPLLALATALAAVAPAMATSPANAQQADGFEFVNTGKDGQCKVLMSSSTKKPVTLWDRKKGLVYGIAIAQPGFCDKTFPSKGGDLTLYRYPSYSIANRVFTAYTDKGDRLIFYRAYGDRYNSRWIKAPTPPKS